MQLNEVSHHNNSFLLLFLIMIAPSICFDEDGSRKVKLIFILKKNPQMIKIILLTFSLGENRLILETHL